MKSVNNLANIIKKIGKPDKTETGQDIWRTYWDRDRYMVDFADNFKAEGWQQYDTDQDAHYFGVWVNPDRLQTLTYAEGDWSLIQCDNQSAYQAELAGMAKFYGSPPPAFTVIDTETATITKHYQERPTV